MGKTRDLIQILVIILIGMFIPFLGSILISFGLDITNINDLWKVGSTFAWFLLIFGIELIVVFIYYKITSRLAGKKLEKLKPK